MLAHISPSQHRDRGGVFDKVPRDRRAQCQAGTCGSDGQASDGHRTPIPYRPRYDVGTLTALETSGGEISAIDVGIRPGLIQLWLTVWGRASARAVPLYDTLRRRAMMISLGVEDVGLRISLDVPAKNSIIS